MLTRLEIAALGLSRGERRLFSGLSFALSGGEAAALTGANGAGKTSLLRAVAGFIRPDAGTIAFHGADGEVEVETARRSALHLLGHHEGLKPQRTARQELVFQVEWMGGSAAAVDAAVARLKLAPLLDLETRKLSAGQRRRLSLARLVAAPRALWLLDEPLAPLDEAWRGVAAELMADHLAGGGMILAAVHDPLPVAARSLDLGGVR
ncbi:ABC transporter involved in cytochrome c biogenesis, ATPase component CcmA [Brevundimonas diminuta 3F5N]|uniref:ABC transporter involved in cytochrome c biogenesis, ATPase component CcmA n=1 Tax=Brevundimonas diminuta 3F5N TaxID=1255603 RepID=A0A1R4GF05_BREDI|nr:heme ABC exporter ATP-binding protein CcmA [Brevundimonas diminuta]SJM66492.1 ABC transporter involved in cytochrome c biogenesis, ATPase component CcmA [Brevundimonas diminuta 3F5N]